MKFTAFQNKYSILDKFKLRVESGPAIAKKYSCQQNEKINFNFKKSKFEKFFSLILLQPK